jgi:hypothetical protein
VAPKITSTSCHYGRLLAVCAVGCALTVAACGSSRKQGASGASHAYAQTVKYSDCIRSHGVSNFPDPFPSGGYPASISEINQQAPAVQSALVSCARLQPGANRTRQGLTAAQLKGMVLNARCIRRHGVPNFPDPTSTPSPSSSGDPFVPGDLNVRSPAVEQAAGACAHVGTQIPGVGSG